MEHCGFEFLAGSSALARLDLKDGRIVGEEGVLALREQLAGQAALLESWQRRCQLLARKDHHEW